MDRPRHRSIGAAQRSLAIRSSSAPDGLGDPVPRGGRDAPPPTPGLRLRRSSRADQGRRAVREGRRSQSDGDVQGTRHGRRGPDGARPWRHASRSAHRGKRGGGPRPVRRGPSRSVHRLAGESRLRRSGPRGPPARGPSRPCRWRHCGRRSHRDGPRFDDGDVQRRDAPRTVPRRGEENDPLRNLGGPPRPAGLIVFPTGGGTGIVGMWKALHELRDLGWFEGPGPRFAVVQAAGCAPLVKAWKEGKETAAPWPEPRTEAAGLCVPSTIADRLVLKALRETRGAATAVSDDAMRVAAQNLAVFEGIATCLEGAATFAGFRGLYDDGVITKEDQVVLVNTGSPRGSDLPPLAAPTVRTADEARTQLGLTKRAS